MMSQDEVSYVSTRSDSTGKLEVNGSLNLGSGYSFKTEGYFMDNDMQKSHLAFELMKEFRDSHISYKFGGGSHSLSMMQSFNSKLMGGFEMFYIVSIVKLFDRFIAPQQGCALLLWSQLQPQHSQLLRSVHANCKEGNHHYRLYWKSK